MNRKDGQITQRLIQGTAATLFALFATPIFLAEFPRKNIDVHVKNMHTVAEYGRSKGHDTVDYHPVIEAAEGIFTASNDFYKTVHAGKYACDVAGQRNRLFKTYPNLSNCRPE